MNDQTESVYKSAPHPRAKSNTGVWLGSILVIVATLGVLIALAFWKYLEIQAAMKMGPPPEMPAVVGIQTVGTISWRNSTGSTGVQWRLNNTATAAWPSVDTSFSSFDIYIGAGVDPSAMSNTFASNFTAGSTQVRSGSLTFLAGSFSNCQTGTTPNAFGPAILFDTPWSYTGGDLTVEFRFSQQVGATNQLALDGLAASGGPGNGWGVDFAARWTGNIAGTTGSNGNFVVTNFMASAIPEPGSAALILLVGGFCAMQRRRD